MRLCLNRRAKFPSDDVAVSTEAKENLSAFLFTGANLAGSLCADAERPNALSSGIAQEGAFACG